MTVLRQKTGGGKNGKFHAEYVVAESLLWHTGS